MRKLFSAPAITFGVIIVFALSLIGPVAISASAQAPASQPKVDAEICYDTQNPTTVYGDCPAGSQVDPNDSTQCLTPVYEYTCPGPFTFTDSHQVVDVAGHYIYADKISVVDVAGHYTCPGGYTLDGSVCHKNNKPDVAATWVPDTYKLVCPTDYSNNPGHDDCRLWVPDTYKTESFSTGPFSYDKSNDPNKCHLPTGVHQSVPSWAMSDFNAQFAEFLDSTASITGYTPSDRPSSLVCPDGGYTLNGNICQKEVTCPTEPVLGCTDPAANNFNPAATVDDGSCTYDEGEILGCMDDTATNFNPAATVDDGSCTYEQVNPCTLPGASTNPLCKKVHIGKWRCSDFFTVLPHLVNAEEFLRWFNHQCLWADDVPGQNK